MDLANGHLLDDVRLGADMTVSKKAFIDHGDWGPRQSLVTFIRLISPDLMRTFDRIESVSPYGSVWAKTAVSPATGYKTSFEKLCRPLSEELIEKYNG